MATPKAWVEAGARAIQRDQDRALACPHPRDTLLIRNILGGMEFRVTDGGPVEFRHGLEIVCGRCKQVLPDTDPLAREAVSFYLANSGAAKLARIVGRGLGIQGTRRPALGAEREADV